MRSFWGSARGRSTRCPWMAASAAPHHRDRGNSVFENELFLLASFQNDRILVETTNAAGQLDAADKVNRH